MTIPNISLKDGKEMHFALSWNSDTHPFPETLDATQVTVVLGCSTRPWEHRALSLGEEHLCHPRLQLRLEGAGVTD